MSNTLTGFNKTVVSAELLKALNPQRFMLNNFYSDFGSEATPPAKAVTVNVPTYTEIADDVSGGITAAAAVTTPYTVNVDKHVGKFYKFSPLEAQQNGLPTLTKAFLAPAVHAVVGSVISSSLDLITITNFGSGSVINQTPALFRGTGSADVAQALSTANIYGNRYMILQPSYFYPMLDSIKAFDTVGQTNTIQNGTIGRFLGMDVGEYNGIPDKIAAENTVGWAGNREAILVVTRLPEVPAGTDMVPFTDPETGLTVMLTSFWDNITKGWYIGAEVIYGVLKGTNTIKRISKGAV